MTVKILCVGAGSMGSAILTGWAKAGFGDSYFIVNPAEVSIENYAGKAQWFFHPDEIDPDFIPDFVLLAVKPQVMPQVMPLYERYAPFSVFVTVAAGLPLSFYTRVLGDAAKIVKIMPNLPVAYGKGACVGFCSSQVSNVEKDLVTNAFASLGEMQWLKKEDDFHAATAISGCGPAYLYALTAVLEKVAIDQGLSEETSRVLARQTVVGASALLENSKETPQALRQKVASPGGVTQAALDVLDQKNGLEKIFQDAIMAAVKRSKELSNG